MGLCVSSRTLESILKKNPELVLYVCVFALSSDSVDSVVLNLLELLDASSKDPCKDSIA